MKKMNTKTLAVTGVLAAITLFLGLTPYGIISIGPANMSFLCVPVAIGTLACGLKTGLLLGGIFGLTSLIKAFTQPSMLILPRLGESAAYVILMSVGARLVIPVCAHLVYKLVTRHGRRCV